MGRKYKGGENDFNMTEEPSGMDDAAGKLATELTEASSCFAAPCGGETIIFMTIEDTIGAMQSSLATVMRKVNDMEETVKGHKKVKK